MKRTTLPLAPSLLKAVREIAKEEGVAMRTVISDLLELALKVRSQNKKTKPAKIFHWHTQAMKPKVDLDDKEAVFKILDSSK